MKRLCTVGIAISLSLAWSSTIAKASESSGLIPTQTRTCPAILGEESTSVDMETTSVEAETVEAETLPVPFVPENVAEDIQSIELLCNPPRYGMDDMRGVVPPSPPVEQKDSFTLYEAPL